MLWNRNVIRIFSNKKVQKMKDLGRSRKSKVKEVVEKKECVENKEEIVYDARKRRGITHRYCCTS